MPVRAIVVLCALTLVTTSSVSGQTAESDTPVTRVMIRAVSHDAKIIGSGVGGARIVVQDVGTGDILAHGVQEGNTGSTTHIMVSPGHRDSTRFDTEGAAGFLAQLPIDEPTVVDIIAYGPLGTPATAMRSSKRMLVVPGHHVLGEGVIIELNGFTVELVEATAAMGKLNLRTRVTMLCGCPTEPGGLWDSNRIDVLASLQSGGRTVTTKKMSYAGRTSTYSAVIDNVPSGVYDVRIVASDDDRGNFGMVLGTAVVP